MSVQLLLQIKNHGFLKGLLAARVPRRSGMLLTAPICAAAQQRVVACSAVRGALPGNKRKI